MQSNRLHALKDRHSKIDHLLGDHISHRAVDDSEVARLKKEKLHIKDEIVRLMHSDVTH